MTNQPDSVEKLWDKYRHEGDENTPDRMFYENFVDAITEAIAEEREGALQKATYDELITEWLARYEGIEHLHVKPEAMYTINTILARCFQKIKSPTR